ncbi:coagulase domain-containing protein, partial [Staphylococcus agnetis]
KKKLLVLSASAILASNFVFDNSASAVVRTTEHESEALKMLNNGRNSYSQQPYLYNGRNSFTQKQYEDDFKNLTHRLSLSDHSGYDELEYQDAYQKYQDRFLAELDAFNKLILKLDPNSGEMTSDKYNKICNSLIQNKEEFMRKVKEIENNKKDLERFGEGDDEFYKAINKVYELEDKVFMVMSAFSSRKHSDALDELYEKLYIIVGTTPTERLEKLPSNQRLLDDMCENLETIIDEFFKEIDLERPREITPLTEKNKDDFDARKKVREDAKKAKLDKQFRDPNVEVRAKKAKAKLDKLTENSRKAKAEAELKAKERQSNKYKSYVQNPEEFKHKTLRQPQTRELAINFPDTNPKLPTYTESTQSHKQPVLKQKVNEEKVDVLKSKRPESALKGMTGESNLVTMDTHSNASTLSGSNDQVFEFSFESVPQTTNVAQPQTKEAVAAPANNLAGLSGESNALNFTYDSQAVNNDTFTESNEIVLDQHTDIKVSGYTTGESIEDSYVTNEVTK